MKLFGQKSNPREKLREMVSTVRRQKYKIQRDIATLKQQNTKVAEDIKRRAKNGNLDEAKILARELVNSRKAASRLQVASAHMDCLISELNCQAATAKMAVAIKSSTAVMKSMSALVKVPDLQKTMQDMGKEMMKMGMMGEMVDDTMDSAMGDPDDMEEATSEEVNKIISEITAGQIAMFDSVATGVPVAGGSTVPEDVGATSVNEEEREDLVDMRARLAALRN